MSVFAPQKLQIFRATVDIGPSSASIISSWTRTQGFTLKDYQTNPCIHGIVRLGQFVYLYINKHIQCTVDWVTYTEHGIVQYSIELKLQAVLPLDISVPASLSGKIQQLMNRNLFILTLQQTFQHAHPGDLSISGMIGTAGNDGDSQSD
jgi:hypothetical protein